MLLRATVIWILLVVLAIINGVTRNAVITPRIGEHAGHVVSTIILSGVIFLLSLMSIRWLAPKSNSDALLIGFLWVILTVAFEFIAGHYLFGNPWEKLVADYSIVRGRVWLLVLVVSFVSPVLAARLRGMS